MWCILFSESGEDEPDEPDEVGEEAGEEAGEQAGEQDEPDAKHQPKKPLDMDSAKMLSNGLMQRWYQSVHAHLRPGQSLSPFSIGAGVRQALAAQRESRLDFGEYVCDGDAASEPCMLFVVMKDT